MYQGVHFIIAVVLLIAGSVFVYKMSEYGIPYALNDRLILTLCAVCAWYHASKVGE